MERNEANVTNVVNNANKGVSMERERYTRKILIVEAHLDDFEIGMSAWLAKMAGYPTEITLVTFCQGINNSAEEDKLRLEYRESNLNGFKKLYPNVKINNIRMGYKDTELDSVSLGKLIKSFYDAVEKNESLKGFNLNHFKEIYFHQADLHTDHTIVNKIGKILTRQYKGKVFEFIITNSGYFSDTINFNTVIRVDYKFNVESFSQKFIYPCVYPTEKTSLQQILYCQKGYDGKYITDRFNLIKDVFVVGD